MEHDGEQNPEMDPELDPGHSCRECVSIYLSLLAPFLFAVEASSVDLLVAIKVISSQPNSFKSSYERLTTSFVPTGAFIAGEIWGVFGDGLRR